MICNVVPEKMKKLWIILIAALPLGDTTLLITGEKVEVRRGQVRSGLLSELNELLRMYPLNIACIHARTTQTSYHLTFFGIPEDLHQRYRNVWGVNWK